VPADAGLRIRSSPWPAPPQGDSAAVAEAARLLVAAESPVMVADRAARTPAGLVLGRTRGTVAGPWSTRPGA